MHELSEGSAAVSHVFVMGWAAALRDIVIGLLIAGGGRRLGGPTRSGSASLGVVAFIFADLINMQILIFYPPLTAVTTRATR